MFALTVRASFCAAHKLPDYRGKCYNLHGHTWAVEATFAGKELQTEGHESGMLIDLKTLKHWLRNVVSCYDHGYLNDSPRFKGGEKPPTAEWVAFEIAESLKTTLSLSLARDKVRLVYVRVYESEDAWVTYWESEHADSSDQ